MAAANLTAARLREALTYIPETGEFFRRRTGKAAGYVDKGYVYMKIDGRAFLAHRLAWLYVYGVWPLGVVDHKVGRSNAIDNLRDVTVAVNSQNLRAAHKDSASGVLGVYWVKQKKQWCAKISVAGRNTYLGYFPDRDAAASAYLSAKRKLHEGCTL